MVASLLALLDDRDGRARVGRRLLDDLEEQLLADVVRAAAGDERAVGIQQLDRAQVDFLVAGGGLRDRRLVLRKGRRIKDDGVEALTGDLELAELVEDVGLADLDVLESVELGV